MLVKMFLIVILFGSSYAEDIQRYLPENPNAVYVYTDATEEHYTVIQNDGISNGCISQYTIGLSSEYPPTNVLSKKDVETFLQNMSSDKFHKSSSRICFNNQKIYNKYIQFFGENKWEFILGKDSTYECSATKKSIYVFQKKRDMIYTVCINKKHNYILQWSFAEGIGKYESEGNSGPSTLVSIFTSMQ